MTDHLWNDRAAGTSHQVLVGDVRLRLRDVRAESVHCCVTSPPYWGVRDNSTCGCVVDARTDQWDNGRKGRRPGSGAISAFRHGKPNPKCRTCKGTGIIARYAKSQLGAELDPDDYLEGMIRVGREVSRALHSTGTWFLNLGDCHAGVAGTMRNSIWLGQQRGQISEASPVYRKWARDYGLLKTKDLVMMPARVALALQGDGWYLFSQNIWLKDSVAPESAKHRPTHSYELVYYLSKGEDPYWDWYEAREPAVSGGAQLRGNPRPAAARHRHEPDRNMAVSTLRNLRDVWRLPGRTAYPGHTSTFPPALPERCIRIGSSGGGACRICGAPFRRVTRKKHAKRIARNHPGQKEDWVVYGRGGKTGGINDGDHPEGVDYIHLGWRATCEHTGKPVPCVVLDPFAGSGTTAAVAAALGRSSISIELREDHGKTILQRVASARRNIELRMELRKEESR